MVRAATIALFLLAAACGGLATPDLRTGVVVGRITGASPAGYVYPLGRPDLKVPLAADGTFRLTAPSGTQSLVVSDGTFQRDPLTGTITSFGHAGLVEVEVAGADVRDLGDRPAAQLPFGGGVLASIRAETGALCKDPRFQLFGTDPDVANVAASSVFLAPLPPGTFQLDVAMSGFVARSLAVTVVSGQITPYDVELFVDESSAVKGCVATTGCDSDELECHADDGRCYATAAAAGATCGASCAGGGLCASGLTCTNAVCVAPVDCPTYFAVASSSCVTDDPCLGGLANGRCLMADDHTAGFCTASCNADADCAAFGATCSSGLCRPYES